MKFEEQPVAVVYFYLPTCGFCKLMKPIFEKVAKRYGSCLPAYTVDAMLHHDLAARYKVKAVPMAVIMRGGKPSRPVGPRNAKQMEALFAKAARGQECVL